MRYVYDSARTYSSSTSVSPRRAPGDKHGIIGSSDQHLHFLTRHHPCHLVIAQRSQKEYCPHCLNGNTKTTVQSLQPGGLWQYPETEASSVRAGLCGDDASPGVNVRLTPLCASLRSRWTAHVLHRSLRSWPLCLSHIRPGSKLVFFLTRRCLPKAAFAHQTHRCCVRDHAATTHAGR